MKNEDIFLTPEFPNNTSDYLRYHGRRIFTNARNLLLAVQIKKTEINILQKEREESSLYFFKIKKNTFFESH